MLLPLSRFFRPSAPARGDKTNRKSSYFVCWGNRGKVITQSCNLLSGFHKPLSLKGYHHPGCSHPLSSTLAGENGSVRVTSWPKQSFLPTTVHVTLLAAKKAASNQHQYTGSTTCQKQKLDAHLTDRYSADAGVQESCGWVGTHFTHKGEFLFPVDTVFLNFLSMGMQKKNTVFK